MITVQFSKNGFYHPAYGRLGRGRNVNKVYSLPDAFGEPGRLPSTTRILERDDLPEILEEEEQAAPIRPKVVDEEQLRRVTAAAPTAAPTRVGPQTSARRSARKPSAKE